MNLQYCVFAYFALIGIGYHKFCLEKKVRIGIKLIAKNGIIIIIRYWYYHWNFRQCSTHQNFPPRSLQLHYHQTAHSALNLHKEKIKYKHIK